MNTVKKRKKKIIHIIQVFIFLVLNFLESVNIVCQHLYFQNNT